MMFASPRRSLSLFAVLVLGVLLSNPAHACSTAALTLSDLIGGETFTTANGLTFSDFDFSVDPSSEIDPDAISVTVLDDGFRITDPMEADDGEVIRIVLSYAVSVDSPELGIAEAFLRMKATTAKAARLPVDGRGSSARW